MTFKERDLTFEEQAALFQAMTVEELKILKGTPVTIDWSEEDLSEIKAFQEEEDMFNVMQSV